MAWIGASSAACWPARHCSALWAPSRRGAAACSIGRAPTRTWPNGLWLGELGAPSTVTSGTAGGAPSTTAVTSGATSTTGPAGATTTTTSLATPDLAVVTGDDPAANVRAALAMLGGMGRFVAKGNKVVLKPNVLTGRAPEYAVTTNPQVMAALVTLCYEAGAAAVTVLDSPTSSPRAAFEESGIAQAVSGRRRAGEVPDRPQLREDRDPAGQVAALLAAGDRRLRCRRVHQRAHRQDPRDGRADHEHEEPDGHHGWSAWHHPRGLRPEDRRRQQPGAAAPGGARRLPHPDAQRADRGQPGRRRRRSRRWWPAPTRWRSTPTARGSSACSPPTWATWSRRPSRAWETIDLAKLSVQKGQA